MSRAAILNQFLRAEAETRGAQLLSIRSSDGTEYLWQGDPAYWSDRAPNLFPYVARLTDGKYYLDGRLYHMEIHGLAPYFDFALKEAGPTQMIFELSSNKKTLTAYPRAFVFRVIYELRDSDLSVTYEVENRDERTMYFGLGAHPGFNVPLSGGTFEDYRLRFDSPCDPTRVGFTEECFLSGKDAHYPLQDRCVLELRHELFDHDAVVLKGTGRRVTLEGPDSHCVTVEFPEMNYLGLWHMPGTDAPYVCIEPWCSLPSAQGKIAVLEEQEDLISLPSRKTYRNTWRIRIRA